MVMVLRVAGALFLLLLCAPSAQAYNLVTVCELPYDSLCPPPVWVEVVRAEDGSVVAIRACWDVDRDPDWHVGPQPRPGGGIIIWIPAGTNMQTDGSHRAEYTGECTATNPAGPIDAFQV